MRKIKICFIFLIIIVFTGCANSDNAITEEEQEPIVLRWYYGERMAREMIGEIIGDYREETGIQIQWQDPEDKGLPVLFASNQMPDIFSLNANELSDWSQRLEDLSGQPWIQDIYEESIEAATIDGKICAMPIKIEACGIIYNKELFAKVGIEELPETVNDLRGVCEKLNAAGIQPFGECYQLSGMAGHTLAVLFAYEKDLDMTLEALRNGTKSIDEMDHYEEWMDLLDLTLDFGIGKKSGYYSIDEQISDFANGKMAMIMQGNWLESLILKENPDIDMGLMAIPCSENEEDCRLMLATTTYLAVNKDSVNVQEAMDFLTWLWQHAQQYLIEMEGASLCFTDIDINALGILNRDMWKYWDYGLVFDGFGGEQWPLGYQDDILRIVQQYISEELEREEVGCELTEAIRLRWQDNNETEED